MADGGRYEGSLYDQLSQMGGAAIADLDRELLLMPDRPVVLQQLKIKLPALKHGEVMLIMLGLADDGTPMIAFMGGDTVARALRKAVSMYADGSLKWRIDEYRIAAG